MNTRRLSSCLPTGPINYDELMQIWHQIVPENADDSIPRAVCLAVITEGITTEDGFAFRPGGWQIDLSNTTVRATVSAGLLYALLVAFGVPEIPVIAVPTVIALLIDVKRVELSGGDEYLLAHLVARKEIRDKLQDAHQLYEMLPKRIQDDLNELEFANFLKRLVASGEADLDAGRYRIRKDSAWIRITFK